LEEANAPNGFDASGAVRVRYCRGSPHDTDDAHRAKGCGQAGGQQGKERDAHAKDGDRPVLGQHVVEGGLPAGRLLEPRRRRQVVWQGAGQRHRALQRWRVLDERGAPRRLRTAWRRVVLGDEEGEGEEGRVAPSLVLSEAKDLLLANQQILRSLGALRMTRIYDPNGLQFPGSLRALHSATGTGMTAGTLPFVTPSGIVLR